MVRGQQRDQADQHGAGQVGGDYYDFLDAGDGLTGVVVADVAGKGVSGSLVMGMLLPHGIIEVPAAILATAAVLAVGLVFGAAGLGVGQFSPPGLPAQPEGIVRKVEQPPATGKEAPCPSCPRCRPSGNSASWRSTSLC